MVVIDYILGTICLVISLLAVLCGGAVMYVIAVALYTFAYNVGKRVENKINERFNEI